MGINIPLKAAPRPIGEMAISAFLLQKDFASDATKKSDNLLKKYYFSYKSLKESFLNYFNLA